MDPETALERQNQLNERIIAEIDLMSKEALAYLKSNFERELWDLRIDDESRMEFRATPQDERLEAFKHVFVQLLVATSVDFAARNVPREHPPDGPARVIRQHSRERRAVGSRLGEPEAEGEGVGGPPPVIRRQSSESRRMVDRFASMKTWEQSDHPIVIFLSEYGDEVSGLEVLSLNEQFLSRFVPRNMQQVLQQNGMDLSSDWSQLKQERALKIVRACEGTALTAGV